MSNVNKDQKFKTLDERVLELKTTDSHSATAAHLRATSSESRHLSLFPALRTWPRLTLWSLALTTTIILWGYDLVLVVSVASMPAFKEVFGVLENDQWIIPSTWLAPWNVSSSLGMAGGALLAGWVGDKIGRRWMLAASTFSSALGTSLCFISDLPTTLNDRCGVFFGGKIIQGISIGAINTTTQTWMSEVVPPQLRGPLLTAFPFFQLIGQIIGSVVVQTQIHKSGRAGYRLCIGTMWIVGAMPLLISFHLPESPVWLLRKGLEDDAFRAYKRLIYSKRNQDPTSGFEILKATIRHEEELAYTDAEQLNYLDCVRGTDKRRTIIVLLTAAIPELFGQHLLGNAGYFLQQIGVSASLANVFFIIGLALTIASLACSTWTLTRFGRRPLMVITLTICAGLWTVIGIAGCSPEGTFLRWFTPVAFMVLAVCAGLGCWPASYVVVAETSSLRLRTPTQGIAWFVNSIVSCVIGFAMPYIYQPGAGNAGAKTGFVYVGTSAAMAAALYFILPEMKGRSQAEIDQLFETEVPARKSKDWRM